MSRILFLTLTVLFASVCAVAQCSDADQQKLIAYDKAWGDAGQRGDKTFLQNVYADDYMNTSIAGTITKTQALDNAVRAAERRSANPQPAAQTTPDNYIIACTPNTATITHRNVTVTKDDGKEQTSYSRSVHFLEKRGGEWRVVSDAGGPLNDAGQLLYMEMDWSEADKRRDAAWFERNFADDYFGISSLTGKLNTKAEDVADVKNRKDVFDSAVSSDMQVRVEGNTGVVTGIYHLKGRDDKGQPIDRRIRYTDIYAKKDGRWQVIGSQGTPIK